MVDKPPLTVSVREVRGRSSFSGDDGFYNEQKKTNQ